MRLPSPLSLPLDLSTRNHRWWAVLLLALGTVAYYGFYTQVWKNAPYARGDTPGYLSVAQDIEHRDFSRLWERTPGYPLIMALTGSAFVPSRALYLWQLTFHLCASLLLTFGLYRLRVPLLVTGLFLVIALLPPQVESALYVLTENATQACLALGVVGLTLWFAGNTPGWLLITGLSFSVAGLIRPTFALLVPVVIALILALAAFRYLKVRRKRLTTSVLMLLLPFLVLDASYIVYNKLRFDYLGVSPWMGFSLTVRTSSFVEYLPQKYDNVRQILIDARNEDYVTSTSRLAGSLYIYSVEAKLRQTMGLNTAQLAQYLQGMNLALIEAQPVKYARSAFSSLSDYWIPELNESTFKSAFFLILWSSLESVVFTLFFAALFLILTLTGVRYFYARLWNFLFQERRAPSAKFLTLLSLWLIIFYSMVVSIMVDIGIPRHRKPTDLLIVFACLLSLTILNEMRQTINRSLAQATATGQRS